MDPEAFNAMSDNFQRIASFQLYPFPAVGGRNLASLLRYNSPLKLAKAGFYRYPNAPGDEVRCFKCAVRYRGWSGESPIAVHRILSPDCPHVVSQTPARLTLTAPATRGARRVRTRRRLQMGPPEPNQAPEDVTDADANQRSVVEVYNDFQRPGTPEQSDNEDDEVGSMLFENHRLLTYPSPTHPLAEEWAAAGFVHQGEGCVVRCVFCGLEMPYDTNEPAKMHRQKSQNCPLVKFLDVGNITKALEDQVRSQNLELTNGDYCVSDRNGEALFKHPQFEDEKERLETFKCWPRQLRPTAHTLYKAGFYFSGYADKVVCFACGCSLRNWDPQANPWTQHARHAPQCVFVRQEKGEDFITQAQDAQVLTDCDTQAEDGTSSSSGSSSSLLRPSLDMSAIKAALERQYDVQQIRHAILKFFLSSHGYYPNEALLLGTLRASDANFSQLQRQREALHTKNLSIIRQADQIERQGQQIEIYGEAMQENQTTLEQEQQRREREVRELRVKLAQRDTRLQGQAHVIRRHFNQLHSTQVQLQDKDHQLGNQGEELERKQREMDRQDEEMRRQAEETRRQAKETRRQMEEVERLRQLLRANNIVDNNQADHDNANIAAPLQPMVPADPSSTYTQCKVCLEEDARCVFRPCRHMCCGTQCAPRFIGEKCPICRDRVNDWEIIYVA